MEALLENPDLASTVDAVVEAVENVLGDENLEKLRQWIGNQPKISWLTDDEFLGAFAKHPADEAQNRLQRLLTAQKIRSQWFENIDTTDPKIQEVFKEGWLLLLPGRDDNGRQLHIARFRMDSSNIDTVSWMRAVVVFFHYQFLIDHKDKSGVVAILDFAGTTFETFDEVMPREIMEEWCHIIDSHYPGHMTHIHYLNTDEKIQNNTLESMKNGFGSKRTELKIYSENLDELYKDVPMRCLPVEYLPADYTGPNAGTLQQVIDYTLSTLTSSEVRDRIAQLSHDQWGIEESSQQSSDEQLSSGD